ncbi:MAG TPA: DivIVA domain-containing protein, partial [Candidatus Limnocylindrales bacterium]|nr:DivIVA domain-containing protein [Candidatus Limnocylindrales bacterium]
MLALFVVVAIVVVAGIAVLVVRDRPLIADDPVGSRTLAWSAQDGVSARDLAEVRFAVALRGYRMEEVDRVLDDTREAMADRDARIADLQRVVAALGGAPADLAPIAADAASEDDAAPADLYDAAPDAPADLYDAASEADTPADAAPVAPAPAAPAPE